MTTVAKMAKLLSDLLAEGGPMSVDEAQEWIKNNDDENPTALSAGDINFTLGYGQQRGRGWWHREGEILVAGPKSRAHKNGASEGGDDDDDLDATEKPTGLPKPENLLREVALSVGVDKDKAKWFSEYASTTFDIYDPAQLTKAMSNAPEIRPSQRRRLLESWLSVNGVKSAEDIAKQYFPTVEERLAGVRNESKGGSNVRRYIVVEGEVLQTEPGEDGFTFGEAYKLALLQRQNMGTLEAPDRGILAVLLQQMGETERARLQLQAEQRPGSDDKTDVMLEWMKQSAETERKKLEIESQRAQNGSKPPPDESLLAVVLKEQAETERTRLQTQTQQVTSAKSELSSVLEAQRAESDARMQLMLQRLESMEREQTVRLEILQKQHQLEMQMLQEQQKNQSELERERRTHDREIMEMQFNREDPDPIGPLNKLLPGLWEKLVNQLINPPKSEPAVNLTLADGERIPFDVFEKFENLRMKRQMLDTTMATLPDLISAGKEAARAMELDARSRRPEVQPLQTVIQPPMQAPVQPYVAPGAVYPPPGTPQPAPPNFVPPPTQVPTQPVPIPQPGPGQVPEDLGPQLIPSACARCGVPVGYPPGSEGFECPVCHTLQFVDGQIIDNTPPAAPVPTPVPPAPPVMPPTGAEVEEDAPPLPTFTPYVGGNQEVVAQEERVNDK